MKKIFTSIAFLTSVITLSATVLSPEEALQRASVSGAMKMKGTASPRLLTTYRSADNTPTLYAFSTGSDEGFSILSADDCAAPVLGYSESGRWDTDNLPPQIEWWMGEYSRQIEYARANPQRFKPLRAPAKAQETRADTYGDPIAPMVTAMWDQTYPFNNECPYDGNSRSVTGCVATAMAQVMYYWKYPEAGIGEITYLNGSGNQEELSIDLSAKRFDWANMIDNYRFSSTLLQRDAVAYLMKACGYSVRMNYSAGSSGTKSELVPAALRTNFSYDKDAQLLARGSSFTEKSWNTKIYEELKYVGPVIYSGTADLSSRMGHCFVCDGYDKDGYFHINWGWSGVCNGYFLLSALNPDTLGTGGGEVSGYNYDQDITLGITPPVGRINISNLAIGNAADDSGNVSGKGYIYRINDPYNIEVSMLVSVTGGAVSTPIDIAIYETDPSTMKNVGLVLEEMLPEKITAPDGTRETFSHSFAFREFDPGKLYTMNVYYTLKGQRQFINSLRFAASSGVDEIAGESLYEAYDLGGRLVATSYGTNPSEALKALPKGIYIIRATDASGRVSTTKAIL